MNSQERDTLKNIIKKKALIFSQGEEFELASGNKSTYFFDMKMVTLDPEGVNLVARCLFDKIKDYDVRYVGGLESGAIPIVAALCMTSWKTRKPLYGFFVRKEPKARGTKKHIEGNLDKGEKVIIIDDVTTEGNSVMKAIEEVRKFGCEIEKVLTIVDREAGARKNLSNIGIEFDALFTKSEFQIQEVMA
jgi:orotate phosphoribosyltransferase